MPLREIVNIALEADDQSLIQDRVFERVLVQGPAVLAPLDDVTFKNNVFDAAPETLFVEIPEGQSVVGFIGLKRVAFLNCEFRNVAIAGTPEAIAYIKANFGVSGTSGVIPPPE